MTVSTTSTLRKITPLNMQITRYRTNYGANPCNMLPNHMIGLALMVPSGLSPKKYEDALYHLAATTVWLGNRIRSGSIPNPVILGPISLQITLTPAMIYMKKNLIAELHPSQLKWFLQGQYIQAAVWDTQRLQGKGPYGFLFRAMTLLDRWVVESGTTDAKFHKSRLVDAHTAKNYRDWCLDYFQNGFAMWNEVFVDIRNRLLIAHRALLLGRDPDVEYNRFLTAGGAYFTEYPELCP